MANLFSGATLAQILNEGVALVMAVDASGNTINNFGSGVAAGVSSLNTLTGGLTIAGAGSASVINAGSTITISGSASSSLGTPTSTTNNAIATWSGTAGAGILNSNYIIDLNNNIIQSASGSTGSLAHDSLIGGNLTNIGASYGSIVFGINSIVSGSQSIAIGSSAKAAGAQSQAFGAFSQALGANAFSAGAFVTASGDFSVALGHSSSTDSTATSSLAFGESAKANHAHAVVLSDNNGASSSKTNELTLGFVGGIRTISGTNIISAFSGVNSIGTVAIPFSGVFAGSIITQSANGAYWKLTVSNSGIVSGTSYAG